MSDISRTDTEKKKAQKFWSEIFLAMRFGTVGILATGVHVAVLWALLSNTLLSPLIANTIAFMSAFGFSFFGNYFWTFGSPGSPRRAIARFLIISASAFFVNSVLLATLLKLGWFSPASSATGSAVVIPAITFLASRLWGFGYSSPTTGSEKLKCYQDYE